MNFWAFNVDFFEFSILMGILGVIFLVANVLRRKIGFLRKSLIPTAVIGGIIMLVLKSIGLFDRILDIAHSNQVMEAMTYHTLALGFIAISLKNNDKEETRKRQREIMDAGLITVNTYAIQGIVGLLITIVLAATISSGLLPAAGLLLPMGFGQGSGQALNFGSMFENGFNFIGGTSFGLTIAAIGFLVACLMGVAHIIQLRKKNMIQTFQDQDAVVTQEVISSPNEVPLTESVDRLTLQLVLILFVYFITFLFMYGVESLNIGAFGDNTVKPLIWGFNFLLGSIFAIVIKQTFKFLRNKNIMTRDYPNNYLLNRLSGAMFDIMIIAGIGAIEISLLVNLILPLALLTLFGATITYFYVRKVTKYAFPAYPHEAFVSLFGTLTGTASTGMILLREVDPQFETPAASNLVFQSFYAILFGFPLFLLLGYAPQGMTESLITLGVLIVMVVFFNIILFRRKIFKAKQKV